MSETLNEEVEKACVVFEPNCNHKCSWDEPEVLVPYPEKALSWEELVDYVGIALTENLLGLEDFVQEHFGYETSTEGVGPMKPGVFEVYGYNTEGHRCTPLSIHLTAYFGEETMRLRVSEIWELHPNSFDLERDEWSPDKWHRTFVSGEARKDV
jgi:hypothetical protein